MGYRNPLTGPISIDPASVIAGVSGSVGSVTTPVDTDPASTIAVVSTSVPFLNKDSFFWPAISGETFPPSLGTGWGYNEVRALPTYRYNQNGGTVPQSVTSPKMPRVGYNGKTNLTVTTTISVTTPGAPAIADIGEFWVGTSASARRAGFRFNATGVAGQYTVDCLTQASSSLAVATFNDASLHTYVVSISAAGVVTFSIDGAIVFVTATADWPSTATDNTAGWTGTGRSAASAFVYHVSDVIYQWT